MGSVTPLPITYIFIKTLYPEFPFSTGSDKKNKHVVARHRIYISSVTCSIVCHESSPLDQTFYLTTSVSLNEFQKKHSLKIFCWVFVNLVKIQNLLYICYILCVILYNKKSKFVAQLTSRPGHRKLNWLLVVYSLFSKKYMIASF